MVHVRWNFIGTATWPTRPWRMLAWWQTGGTWNRPGKSWMQPALRWEHLHWWSMGIPFAWACWVICRRGSKNTSDKKWPCLAQEFLEVQTWYNHGSTNPLFFCMIFLVVNWWWKGCLIPVARCLPGLPGRFAASRWLLPEGFQENGDDSRHACQATGHPWCEHQHVHQCSDEGVSCSLQDGYCLVPLLNVSV